MDWTEREIEDQWFYWRAALARNGEFDVGLDEEVRPFLKIEARGPWLRRMRCASLMTVREAARRMGIKPSAYFRFEKRERNGAISLVNLRKCAAALDCEVVYILRPRCRKLPSRRIYDLIVPQLRRTFSWKLFALAAWKFRCPKFRKRMGWARNLRASVPWALD